MDAGSSFTAWWQEATYKRHSSDMRNCKRTLQHLMALQCKPKYVCQLIQLAFCCKTVLPISVLPVQYKYCSPSTAIWWRWRVHAPVFEARPLFQHQPIWLIFDSVPPLLFEDIKKKAPVVYIQLFINTFPAQKMANKCSVGWRNNGPLVVLV